MGENKKKQRVLSARTSQLDTYKASSVLTASQLLRSRRYFTATLASHRGSLKHLQDAKNIESRKVEDLTAKLAACRASQSLAEARSLELQEESDEHKRSVVRLKTRVKTTSLNKKAAQTRARRAASSRRLLYEGRKDEEKEGRLTKKGAYTPNARRLAVRLVTLGIPACKTGEAIAAVRDFNLPRGKKRKRSEERAPSPRSVSRFVQEMDIQADMQIGQEITIAAGK